MGKPKKALLLSQLKYLTAGKVDGSHDICKVEFIEDGITKVAFLKKLEPTNHYPELLAKMSVAASVFKRLFQGKNTAEERLVYDKDDGRIVGTLSITIDGFKPFNYANEVIPTDPVLREQVVPSAVTLIEKNAMETLFSRWFLDDDDSHPHNLGFAGDHTVDIDFDMFWYWFTIHMKEPRPIVGIPKTRVNLTVNDWENFPHTTDSMHYHGVTYSRPGQVSLSSGLPGEELVLGQVLPKSYADPKEFLSLASSPQAREQLFNTALKALLAFNPEMVRHRLQEHFGAAAFNYTSLKETNTTLCTIYEEKFPGFCNPTTNTKPFVDFIMQIYQEHYDNLYRVVVFYMGCAENKYQMPLKPTYFELYRKPSVYKNICLWMQQQNEALGLNEQETHYDLEAVETRYHQIWRDAFAPRLRELLHGVYNLTKKLIEQSSSYVASELCFKQADDQSLTEVWDLFGAIPELATAKIADLITLDPNSEYRSALSLMVEFTNKFRELTKKYYEKEPKDLVPADSTAFVNELSCLYREYDLKIRKALFITTPAANEFNRIAADIKQFTDQADFQIHLITTDEQMRDAAALIINKDLLPSTDNTVIEQYIKSLFAWAKNVKPADLEHYIQDIVANKYEKTLSNRHRGPQVRNYLAKSKDDTGDNRLAYIFSSGSNDNGELNQLLIEHLTPKMLETYPIMTVRNAVSDGSFNNNKSLYTTAVVRAAKEEPRFMHLCSTQGVKLFYETLYQWTNSLSAKEFTQLKAAALKEYQDGKSYVGSFFYSSRANEFAAYEKYSQAKQVAMIFLKGDGSSLTQILLKYIIAEIQKAASGNKTMLEHAGYRLMLQYNKETHPHIVTDKVIKKHAEGPSHQEELPSSSSSPIPMRAMAIKGQKAESSTSFSL